MPPSLKRDLSSWQRRWPDWSAPADASGVAVERRRKAALTIAEGTLADVAFLTRNVVSGVPEQVFSPSCSGVREQMRLTYVAAKAILQQRMPWLRLDARLSFVVVRQRGATVAAALLMVKTVGGQRTTVIDCIVVDPAERRHAIGRALVDYVISTAPEGSNVTWFCSPKARGMKKLAHRNGLRNVESACPVGTLIRPHRFAMTKPVCRDAIGI